VCIEGNVYVMGGFYHNIYGGSSLRSVEMYDRSVGPRHWQPEWRALPAGEMSVARGGCAAVCIDGNLCVVGGLGHDGAVDDACDSEF
jgi:hypothetical protein